MLRFPLRALPLIAFVLANGVASAQEETYRLQLFSTLDRSVVAVGEEVTLTVEGLAVPESDEAAAALLQAFGRIAFAPEAAEGFDVVRAEGEAPRRRAGTDIYELERRFVMRARRSGTLTVPAIDVLLGDAVVSTRPARLFAYERLNAFDAAARAVVPVVAEGRMGRQTLQRMGSGFFIAEDAIVTAYHVVLDAEEVRLLLPDGRRVTTRRVWAVDPVRDVAVLHVDPGAARRAGVVPLALAPRFDTDLLGDEETGVTFTAGWPGGVQQPTEGMRHPSLRFGRAALLRVTSNPVQAGDSGGPLLDRHGRVLGVVSSGRGQGGSTDFLREDLCLATDPRWALAERLAQRAPMPMHRALQVAAETAPNADVLQAATLLRDTQTRGARAEAQRERIRNALREAPTDATLQFLAGSVYQSLGDETAAAAAYRAALAQQEAFFPATYALGHVHLSQGDLDEAEARFTETHASAPYARLGALGLARVYTAQLRYAEATRYLHEVLATRPRYAPALYLLGYGHLAEGRHAEAEALAVRLDRISPIWADALRIHLRDALRPSVLAALPRVSDATPAP